MEQVIFLGWNQDCADAGQIMTDDPGSPMKILGAIRPPGQDFAQPLPPELCDFGSYEDLPEVLASGHVDMLITSDTELKREDLSLTITLCEKEMVGFQLVPTCFRVLLGGLNLEKIFGMPLLGISRLPLHSRVNLFIIKRVIDFIGGLVGIVVGAPLIALFGAIIYLESPGPIFYRQRRVGQRGREFDIIKLRSMKIDSEADTGAVWAVENDPRRLKIGKFLRASNIDEIPQFWNVMKGEMSLVGPRPERPELIKKFRDEIPHYNARHSIKPGITGWAQVNGLRGNTDLTERIKYDLHYIERWNILFDFQIMFLTFLKRENAY
jgi:exopolysaccharide biosynthesis polyprenyl glycosylphosphotransferase